MLVELVYDWRGAAKDSPGVGDVLVTKAGTCYLIHKRREVRPRSELPAGVKLRLRLDCERMTHMDVPREKGRMWFELVWNPRSRHRG